MFSHLEILLLIILDIGDMLWAMNSGPPGSQYQRRYVGQYVEDKRHGKGEMTYPNGDRYTGEISKYISNIPKT